MRENIAIFLCDCGKSLKNVDFNMVREKIGGLQDVIHVGLSSALCLKEGLGEMISVIREKDVNRVVIAACSPELKEPLFRRAIEEAGLNPNLLSMMNIREQCSWAHEGDVTWKAIEMIRMAVSRARLLREIKREKVEVTRKVLIVGGGPDGVRTALEISRLGLKTTLVEKMACHLPIEELDDIEVLTGASVVKVEGEVGNFSVRIRRGGEERRCEFGAIIFADGQIAEILQGGDLSTRPETVAFVLDLYGESTRLSTLSTLKNALTVKRKLGSEVYVLCRNLKVDSEGAEALYREARSQGVIFLKFEGEPKIEPCEDGRVKIGVKDQLLGDEVNLICDLVVDEGKALPPEEVEIVDSMLKAGTDSQGFYQDENVHLYPVSSRRKGMFFVGSCRGDLDPVRAAMDISSVAISVYELLSRGKVSVEVGRVKIEPDKCRACLTCFRLCPHEAIRLTHMDEVGEVAQIYDLACDECGICAAICPAKAIEFSREDDGQILAQIEAMEEGGIVAFCCAESAYRAADRAGELGLRYPSQVRVIRVPCAGRVDTLHILKAFERGAEGVLVMGCPDGACRHLEGNIRTKERVKYVQNLLEEMGMEGERVRMVTLGPDMAWRFVQEVSGMMKERG
jgi:heterodisulfide reductase subunit A